MITLYWALEYAKVLFAYIFLFFIWPYIVFDKKLKNKSLTFKYAFCMVAMPVVVSSLVLGLGLFHLLYQWIIVAIFYGVFVYKLFIFIKGRHNYVEALRRIVTGTYGAKNLLLKIKSLIVKQIKAVCKHMYAILKGHLVEYLTLAVIVLFGLIYFSYGAFQDNSYGFGDCYTHNSWIYGLSQGQIFSAGVYPEGMHCVIYTMSAMFGIRVFSIILFLQGIHSVAFLLSAYIFLKEVFRFKYSPHIALTLFLTLDLYCIDMIYGMSRLQWTIPQEFALYTPFLCVAFLVRYMKSGETVQIPEGPRKKIISRTLKGLLSDDNMLVFSLSIATSLIVHFYPTIMAVFMCAAFVPVMVKKFFRLQNIAVIASVAFLGFVIAVIPMAGALASGIPFQGSIGWAVSVINGEDPESGFQVKDEADVDENGESISEENNRSILDIVKGVYNSGYIGLYGPDRGKKVLSLSVIALIMFVICRILITLRRIRYRDDGIDTTIYDHYFSLVLISVIMITMYCAPFIGIIAFISGSRLCTTINILVMGVCVIPFDALMSLFEEGTKRISDLVGVVAVFGIYVMTQVLGIFHGYLYYELTRYNSAVITTKKITETVPKDSFTIVSTGDELYQMIDYGFHEELLTFANECVKDEYTLPTEYVFIYVEKHPLKYAQFHFFEGPDWLAKEKYKAKYGKDYTSQCPKIVHMNISPELSRPPFKYYQSSFKAYKDDFSRMVIESRINEWCREFGDLYPDEMHTFYEDDDFVCYYFRQNPSCLYQLAFQSAYTENNAKGIWD